MLLRVIWLMSIVSSWFSYIYSAQKMSSMSENSFDRGALIQQAGRALLRNVEIPELLKNKEVREIKCEDFERVFRSIIKIFLLTVLRNQNYKVKMLSDGDCELIDKIFQSERWLKRLLAPSIILNIMALTIVFSKRFMYLEAFSKFLLEDVDAKFFSALNILDDVSFVNVQGLAADILAVEGDDEAWILKKDKRMLEAIRENKLTAWLKSEFYYVSCDPYVIFLSKLADTVPSTPVVKKDPMIILRKNKKLEKITFEEDIQGNDDEDFVDELERMVLERKQRELLKPKSPVVVKSAPKIPEVVQRAVDPSRGARRPVQVHQQAGKSSIELLAELLVGKHRK